MTASKSGCFIATACYGDYNHPVVIELRQFRDEILQPAKSGQVFIHWYYEWSPTFASFVAKNGILKTIVRFAIVAPVVFAIRIAKNIKRMNNL